MFVINSRLIWGLHNTLMSILLWHTFNHLCMLQCQRSRPANTSIRPVSWCNLAKSYTFEFLSEWRTRWYRILVRNIIVSRDRNLSPLLFPSVNFRRLGDFDIKIILIKVCHILKEKTSVGQKLHKLFKYLTKCAYSFGTYFNWLTDWLTDWLTNANIYFCLWKEVKTSDKRKQKNVTIGHGLSQRP